MDMGGMEAVWMEERGSQIMEKGVTDWFRGIAVIMVVLSHYAQWWTWFAATEGKWEVLRLGVSKLGAYGVDIFFLFSGYAMVHSMGQERMYPNFIWKRVRNVFFPYFLVVGSIELVSDGFHSWQDFWDFISGKDYWYMHVLFLFYIGFIVIYTIMGGKGSRCVVFCIFTYCMSYGMYREGMADFWFVSNAAFAIGVAVGEYEEEVGKLIKKAGGLLMAVLGAGMALAVRSGLEPGIAAEKGAEELLRMEIGASLIWTLLVLVLTVKCSRKGKVLSYLGKRSLYIYLTHTFIFMWMVNVLECGIALRFLVSATVTVIVSIWCNLLIKGIGSKIKSVVR